MFLIAYLISLFIFWLVELLVASLTLLSITVMGRVLGFNGLNFRGLTQFFAAFVGSSIGGFIAYSVCGWFIESPSSFLCGLLFAALWFWRNRYIPIVFHPVYQRLGIILGLIAFGLFVNS